MTPLNSPPRGGRQRSPAVRKDPPRGAPPGDQRDLGESRRRDGGRTETHRGEPAGGEQPDPCRLVRGRREWAEAEAEPASAASDIKELLGRLSQRQREIVVGMAIEGRSAKELGERLGMADGTVRVVLHRSLRLLADIVRKGKP